MAKGGYGDPLYGAHAPAVADDGKGRAEYNTEHGRESSASTSGTPARVTPVGSAKGKRVPSAYLKGKS